MPSSTESLKAHLMWGALGSGVLAAANKALALATAILLARILGADGFGYYTFALGVLTILAVPAQLGLPQLITREIASAHALNKWGELRGLRHRATQLAALAVCAAAAIALGFLSFARFVPAIDSGTFLLAIALLPLMVSMELLAGLLRGLRKVLHAMWPVAALKPGMMILILLTAAMLGVPISPPRAMTANIVATLSSVAVLAFLMVRFWPASARHADPHYRNQDWLRKLLPFSMLGAANLITQKTDIVMLGFLTTPSDVGIYQVVVQGAMLVSFGFMAMNAVLSPNVARLHAQGNMAGLEHLMVRSSAVVFSIAVVAMVILAFFGESLLEIVFGTEFRRGYAPLLVLGIGQVVNAAVGSVGTFLSMTGNERDTLRAIITAALANIVLNALLIPPFGIIGAAVATMLSTVLWNAIMAVAVHKRLGFLPGPVPARWKK